MRFYPAGDQALVVEYGTVIAEEINEQVQQLARQLTERPLRGVREVVPTFRSLLVCYDNQRTNYERLVRAIKKLPQVAAGEAKAKKKVLLVPCCYEGAFAPDAADLEQLTGLSFAEIVKIHSSVDYKIYMLGFLPGFVYLGGLDERIHAKRLDTPRVSIAPGSVGIGGNQTGVYPLASPGGWRLLGATPLEFYNQNRERPVLCEPGEYIRFVPISAKEYAGIKAKVDAGEYKAEYA